MTFLSNEEWAEYLPRKPLYQLLTENLFLSSIFMQKVFEPAMTMIQPKWLQDSCFKFYHMSSLCLNMNQLKYLWLQKQCNLPGYLNYWVLSAKVSYNWKHYHDSTIRAVTIKMHQTIDVSFQPYQMCKLLVVLSILIHPMIMPLPYTMSCDHKIIFFSSDSKYKQF